MTTSRQSWLTVPFILLVTMLTLSACGDAFYIVTDVPTPTKVPTRTPKPTAVPTLKVVIRPTSTPVIIKTPTPVPFWAWPTDTPQPTIKPTRKVVQQGCVIKGNISFNSGEKIYHMPGQEYYSSTTINTKYGERWFCTEAEAALAGWRKSKR